MGQEQFYNYSMKTNISSILGLIVVKRFWFLLPFFVVIVSCSPRSTEDLIDRKPLCQVLETVYADGTKTCGEIIVYSDQTYIWLQTNVWSKEPPIMNTQTGRLEMHLFDSLKGSISGSPQWKPANGVPTFILNIDDSHSEKPPSVAQLLDFLQTQHASDKKE